MINKKLFILLSTFLLTGCFVPKGPVYNTVNPSKKDNLYVYREASAFNRGMPCDFNVDNKTVGELRDGGYIPVHLPSGAHEVAISCSHFVGVSGTVQKSVVVTAGTKNYLKFDVSTRMTGKDVAQSIVGVALASFTGIGFMTMTHDMHLDTVPSATAVNDMHLLRQSI